MRSLRYGSPAWLEYLRARSHGQAGSSEVARVAARIVSEVRQQGDRALLRLTRQLDGVSLTRAELRVPGGAVRRLALLAAPELRRALREMAARLTAFHRRQRDEGFAVRLRDGSVLEEVVRPIESAALYVPGGAGAYPSSVLMSAIPARLAGVGRLQVVTPPRTLQTNPSVAAALVEAGLQEHVFAVGGAQAIAACAYGTETIPGVVKIVGPGNAYVAAAKRLLRGVVEVDTDAGPSEVVILADQTADPAWVAADLLAQAEHGSGEEMVVLVTPSASLAREVARRMRAEMGTVANPAAVRRALQSLGVMVSVSSIDAGVRAVNALAAEHVQVMVRNADAVARRLLGGAVFVGPWAPAAVGDYGIGPNHVLPTGGAARFASPLSVRDFQRRQSQVRLTPAGLERVGAGMVRVALAEGFTGHARSLTARLSS